MCSSLCIVYIKQFAKIGNIATSATRQQKCAISIQICVDFRRELHFLAGVRVLLLGTEMVYMITYRYNNGIV